MNVGKMRHRIVIESPTVTQTASGTSVESWATHATVWAGIVEFGGQENIVAEQVEARLQRKVKIRHLSTVTTEMRVNDADKSRILNIIAIEGDETDAEYMWLHCVEVD